MEKIRSIAIIFTFGMFSLFILTQGVFAISDVYKENIYQVGRLKPIDSVLRVKKGQVAPDFTLPSISGEKVSLKQYRGKKNVVLSFVPAAWTPVCSDQWPGYNWSRGFLTNTMQFSLGLRWIISPPYSHGPIRWGSFGSLCSLTSGLMGGWQKIWRITV